MKKILALILALTLCMSVMGGCGKTDDIAVGGEPANNETEEEVKNERPTFTAEDKLIALSFDDGPSLGSTSALLDYFEEMDIVGTFFVIGDNVNDETAEVMKRAYEMGCEIGNHTKSHQNMSTMSADEVISEIEYVQDIVYDYIGVEPVLFRPPFLAVSQTMHDNISNTFIFGKDSLDWTGISADERAQNILNFADDGVIVLMHDGWENFDTVEAVKIIVPILMEKGYQFCTISELFEAKGVEPEEYSGVIYSTAWGK